MKYKAIKLRKEALESCNWRGHKMGRFIRIKHTMNGKPIEREWQSTCKVCGKSVWINIAPLPNQIDICGEAVALNCTD